MTSQHSPFEDTFLVSSKVRSRLKPLDKNLNPSTLLILLEHRTAGTRESACRVVHSTLGIESSSVLHHRLLLRKSILVFLQLELDHSVGTKRSESISLYSPAYSIDDQRGTERLLE